MLKTLTLEVPKHLKKFLESEYGQLDKQGRINLEKWNELGRLLHLVSRVVPYTQKVRTTSGTTITFAYNTREKAYEIPYEKVPDLVRQLDEIFRRSLTTYVSSKHEDSGPDYSDHIRRFLARYDIIADVDISWEVVRKIYRDYLSRTERRNANLRKMAEIRSVPQNISAQKVRVRA